MPKIISNFVKMKPVNAEVGMFFKSKNNDVYMVVGVSEGKYLVNLENGYDWDGYNLEGMSVREVEEREQMQFININSITLE